MWSVEHDLRKWVLGFFSFLSLSLSLGIQLRGQVVPGATFV
jgi:hypothetical protein